MFTFNRGYNIASLEKRRDEWKREEEDRIRNTPDPDMPAGHKLMPSEERYETLNLLKQSRNIIVTDIKQLK